MTSNVASLATHVRGSPVPKSDHDSGTVASMAPGECGKTYVPIKIERVVRDALAHRIRREIEWGTPAGSIDVFAKNEVIEVKHYKQWKTGIGQVMAYGAHYPSHTKRLHLFAHRGERASKHVEMATKVCSTQDIHVTFKEVLPGSNDLVVDEASIHGKSNVDTGVTYGVRKKGGIRVNNLQYRESAFATMNQLILEARKNTLKEFGKDKEPQRETLEFSLKNNQENIELLSTTRLRVFCTR